MIHYGLGSVPVLYYEMFSWLLAMVTGMLFAFVGGLVVLGEIDDNVAKYILVTPAGMRGISELKNHDPCNYPGSGSEKISGHFGRIGKTADRID